MPSDLDDFEVISTIRTGCYGLSKKVRNKRNGKIMVLKEVEYTTMTESEKRVLLSEVNLLRGLFGKYIVSHHNRIIDRPRSVIHIIMEYYEGGDLDRIIVKNRQEGTHIPQQFILKIFVQMTLALRACHKWQKRPVLHRDLKPANVFLDAEYNVKLGDFGLASIKTPHYMSPELINNQPYDEKSDIWSLGCLLYELCALVPPFTASNQSDLNRKILTGDFPRIPSQYSLQLDKIIREIIQVEACNRKSLDVILMKCNLERMLDCPDCEYADRNKKIMCFIDSLRNQSSRHGKIKYEDTLAKERQDKLREKERCRKCAASKERSEEDMLKLVKMPRRCDTEDLSASDCEVDEAEQGTRTLPVLIYESKMLDIADLN